MYETHLVKKCRLNELPAADGRFYVIVTIDDGKQFQVKFNVANSRGNQKELISNFVGKEIEASVLDGAFLKFSQNQVDGICLKLKQLGFIPPNLSCFSKKIFFGVEWFEEAKKLDCEEDLKEALDECKNKNEFFSVYPFDQYLRNYDRFYKNHLIVKRHGEDKPSHYAIIDGDRIFGSTSFDRIDEEKELFNCFHEPFHGTLYSLVNDSTYTHVYRFLAKITLVSTGKLFELMNKIYDDPKLEHGKIKEVLEYRKDKIFDYCDGSCFENVSKKRLA